VPRRFDLMTTTHPDAPVVLCSLSAGAEGEVIAAFTRAGRRWSRAWFTAAGLLGGRRYELALEVDGEPVESPPGLFNAGIYNAPCYGFGLRFWKGHGRFDDGAAEGVTWRTAGDYLRLAVSRGPRRPSGVKLIPGRRFRLESDGPIQVDGESLPPGPQLVELRVEPGAWRAIVAKDVPNRSIPQPSQ
jgi:diacylglycerol kinase family enzyme